MQYKKSVTPGSHRPIYKENRITRRERVILFQRENPYSYTVYIIVL